MTQSKTEGDWRKEFEKNRPKDDYEHCDNGSSEGEIHEFGYKWLDGLNSTIHEVVDWGNLKKFIEQVEKESYEKGVASAYRGLEYMERLKALYH